MSREIVEAITGLEQEKGIDAETLMAALEDALLSAYKKTPGAAKYARVDLDRDTADFRVFELILPPELEEKLLAQVDRGAGADDRPRDRRAARARGARARPGDPGSLRGPDHEPRRHPRRLRAHRRPDREAGDPAADPRGRAADDVRRVPGPRRRADHRDHPAVRQPLHAGPAARARRGAAAALRAGLERALRPRDARQGRDHRRLGRGQGPEHRRLAAQPGADQGAVRARGPRDRRRPRRDRRRRPRARLPLEDRGRSRTPTASTRSGACVGPRGSRVRMVVSELRGEKIDIIPYNEEPARFVAKALSPARVREVLVDDETQGGDGDRPRRPALAGDRPRGPERPPRRQAHRLEGRHQVGDRVQPEEDELDYEDASEERRRPLRRGPLGRAPLPERSLSGLALLRPAPASGARPLRHQPGDGALRPLRRGGRGARRPQAPTTLRCGRSSSAPPPRSKAEARGRGALRGRDGRRGARGGRGGAEEAKEQAEADGRGGRARSSKRPRRRPPRASRPTKPRRSPRSRAGRSRRRPPPTRGEEADGDADAGRRRERRSRRDVLESEVALAEDAATEAEEPSAEAATVGANPSEEPEAAGEDSEGSRSEGA